jgi:hypothetical protein
MVNCIVCGKEMKRKPMSTEGWYFYRCKMCGDYSERLEFEGELLL